MIVLFVLLFAVSFAGTGLIRRYCLAKGIVDIPNQRSSHSRIVARGGGIGFSGIFLLIVLALGIAGVMPIRAVAGLAGGGTMIAVTGWMDDRKEKGLSAATRIILHLIAAVWAVLWLGPVPAIVSGSAVWMWVTQAVGVVAITWMINLYNFMDGTDGIAGVEAVTAAIVSGLLCMTAGLAAIGNVYWLLAALVAGFLVWNWHPAKIFMGDAGSGFLGFTFGALTLWASAENARLLWPCMILLSVFVADATSTVLRRMVQGEKWYAAHNSHAYQKLARRKGHLPVALGVTGINLVLLTPLAWMAWLHPAFGFPLAIGLNGALAGIALTVRDKR
jgi:Fuc2NAc and GlcNAc transferase